MAILIVIILLVFILSLFLGIRRLEAKVRPSGVTVIAAIHIFVGLMALNTMATFIKTIKYVQPNSRVVLISCFAAAALIMISVGWGLLRVKKWAIICSFITGPIVYASICFIITMQLAGFPLAPFISLLVFITAIIAQAVYFRKVNTESAEVAKAHTPALNVQELFPGLEKFSDFYNNSRFEILGIAAGVLLLLLLWFLGI